MAYARLTASKAGDGEYRTENRERGVHGVNRWGGGAGVQGVESRGETSAQELPLEGGAIVPLLTNREPQSLTHMDLAIDIRNVVKRYEEHIAVRDLSLQVPRGSVYGLLGPNGAGKTTTIRMMLGIIAPDAGSISLFGKPHLTSGLLDRVGYLPEERGLYKKMQVKRVLMFLAELKGMKPKEAAHRIDEWLERLSLTSADKNWGEARVDELSRGMQQKVQFIAALVHDPDLIVLDEPFSGLDPINAQALKDNVVELRRRGKTVVFSTHIMENAEKMCDSVCIVSRGEKVLDGSIAEVKQQHGGRNVALSLIGVVATTQHRVGDVLRDVQLITRFDDTNRVIELELAPQADAQTLLRRLIDAGASIERFELVQPSLHQIFLQRVGASGVETGMSGHG
jgi:ABC-2 type transport system ATP-binding protein